MRTTLDLPKNLLIQAKQLSNATTKTAVIKPALKELIKKSKIAELKNYKGKIDLNIDLDTQKTILVAVLS